MKQKLDKKGVSDLWPKRSQAEVEKTRDEAARNNSDTSMASQHNNSNDNDNIVSSPSARQDDDSNEEDERDFSTFFARKRFLVFEETSFR